MKVKNITYKQYLELNNDEFNKYNYYLKYGKLEGLDLFGFGDFINNTFAFVKDFQDILNSESGLIWSVFFDEVSKLTSKPINELASYSIFELQQCRVFIRDQVNLINTIESNALGYASSANEQAAGIDVFSEYKAFLQYDKLTGGDITKIADVKKLKYTICLTKLKLEKDRAEFEQRLNKIASR